MPLPKPPVPTYELEIPSTGKTIKYRPFPGEGRKGFAYCYGISRREDD